MYSVKRTALPYAFSSTSPLTATNPFLLRGFLLTPSDNRATTRKPELQEADAKEVSHLIL